MRAIFVIFNRFEEEKERLKSKEEEELGSAMETWRVEGMKLVEERAARLQEELEAVAPPSQAEYREVLSDGSGARHVAATMQLVRDWASLGTDDDGTIANAYNEFANKQKGALRDVRELYVSQLQKLAELLMTRSPPAPDELLDIIESSMKHVLTTHKHASGLAPDEALLSEREGMETERCVERCNVHQLNIGSVDHAHHNMGRGKIAHREYEINTLETQGMGKCDDIQQTIDNGPLCLGSRPLNLKIKCRAHYLRN